MAFEDNDAVTTQATKESKATAPNGTNHTTENDVSEKKEEKAEEQPIDSVFQLTINLPRAPGKTQIMVSSQEQLQDIRQSIIDFPFTFQYSCFHLEHNGQRVNDFIELSEVPGVMEKPELDLVEDPYTEKEARVHVLRVRELVGAAGDRTDLVHGISAGQTLHDTLQLPGLGADKNGAGDQHAMSDFDFDAPGSFTTLLPPQQDPAPKPLKAISLSPWNPPPYHLRTKGHLLYLQITTNEGEQFQITSHVSGFYVNKSSSNKFDPSPKTNPKAQHAHSLLILASQLSPSFDSTFKALQEHNGRRDPLASYQLSNAIPASPWMVSSSELQAHQADITRNQEANLISAIDGSETLRDWNEEFQSTRELPKETVQDRVFRERLTNKLFADYNEAATRGAVLVARGEVPPLNPTEKGDAQIFVYNNVFFSFGADGVGTFASDGADDAARVATGKDVMGVKAVNQLDINGLFTPATVVVDYMGKRLVGQSIVPGIFKQREPGEHQIDYGGVEGREVVAEHEAFVEPFSQLSKALRIKKHPVWDKEGKRHDLEGSVETKGLLGTDGRKYVLDLYRITPLDIAWLEQHWTENDGKGYPHRMAVLRPELVDSYWRIKLREYVGKELEQRAENRKSQGVAKKKEESQLTNGNHKEKENTTTTDESSASKEAETTKDKEQEQDQEQERVDVSGFQFALNTDVFSGQVAQTEEEKRNMAEDEAEVRAVCKHLTEDVMPKLVRDLQEGDTGFPMDGQSLTSLLHKRGVNVRYLGKLATMADQPNPRLQALRRLCIQEIISRSFKHFCNRTIRHLPAPLVTTCVAHLLNCLLGIEYNSNPSANTDQELKALYSSADFEWEKITPDILQNELAVQASRRYRFEFVAGWTKEMKSMQMLREISLKMGLQLEAKNYQFSSAASPEPARLANGASEPTTNGHSTTSAKKKKNKSSGHHSPPRAASLSPTATSQTFHADDILNIVPLLKECSPRSLLASEALDAGQISLQQGPSQVALGKELLLESLSLHEQIYGILHPEVVRVYGILASIYWSLDEKEAAVELARKGVVVGERCLGVDAAEVLGAYASLGLFEHGIGNTGAALAYLRHTLSLWKVVYGTAHPDSITTLNNAAVMLQHLRKYHDSRLWFEKSLQVCEEVSGKSSVNTATLLFQLAQALALDQDPKGAVHRMREAYNVFHRELGADDRNTKEAENWLEQLTQNAVSLAKHAKDLQARKIRRFGTLSPRFTLGAQRPPQAQVGAQTAQDVATTRAASGMNEKSIEELVRYIEGGDQKQTTPRKKAGNANPKRRSEKVR